MGGGGTSGEKGVVCMVAGGRVGKEAEFLSTVFSPQREYCSGIRDNFQKRIRRYQAANIIRCKNLNG